MRQGYNDKGRDSPHQDVMIIFMHPFAKFPIL